MFNALVTFSQLIGVVVLILILARLSQIERHLNPHKQAIQEARKHHQTDLWEGL